jgi:hypothetical protein
MARWWTARRISSHRCPRLCGHRPPGAPARGGSWHRRPVAAGCHGAACPDAPDDVPTLVDAYKTAFADLRQSGDGVACPRSIPARWTACPRWPQSPGRFWAWQRASPAGACASDRAPRPRGPRSRPCRSPTITRPSRIPRCCLPALRQTGVDAKNATMIGDTTYDIEMGRAAGFRTIGVSWGYHPVIGPAGGARRPHGRRFCRLASASAEVYRPMTGWKAKRFWTNAHRDAGCNGVACPA